LHGHTKFISAQNEYSLIARDVEVEVLPAVVEYGLGFLPFFPLFNGLFTGKYTRGGGGPADGRLTSTRPEALERVDWDAMEQYQSFCDARGITMLEATIGWFLVQPGVTSIIAGATKPEQVVQNVAAGAAWTPSAEDAATISGFFPR
jgi:1-deoxyxylulose-5-phosphate synthase